MEDTNNTTTTESSHGMPPIEKARVSGPVDVPPDLAEQDRLFSETRKGPGSGRDQVCKPEQQYAVISFVAPKGANQRAKHIAVKLRGVFGTIEEAKEWINNKLRPYDNEFDLWIVSMWEWIVLPLPLDMIRQVRRDYHDPRMQGIMQRYFDDMDRDKINMERRLKKVKEDAKANFKRDEIKNRKELRKKRLKEAYISKEGIEYKERVEQIRNQQQQQQQQQNGNDDSESTTYTSM